MTEQGGLPSYDQISLRSNIVPEGTWAPQPGDRTGQQDIDATVVLLCHYDGSKPDGRAVVASCHEAVLLPPNMTRDELVCHLVEQTIKRERHLKIAKHGEWSTLLFKNGKPGGEVVPVTDEESWQACRVLMKKTPGSRLRFYVFPERSTESGSDEVLEQQPKSCVERGGGDMLDHQWRSSNRGGRGKMIEQQPRSKKKCIVQ